MKKVYLDNAATTPLDERVVDAMLPYLRDSYGNPSSVHSWGRESKVMLEEARESVADFIGAKPSEIYFTSGGTEANNFAIKGLALANLGKKNHIISSKIEHHSVIDSLEYLQTRFGLKVTYLDNDKFGRVDIDHLQDAITENTFLICVMHSNNELGIINDIPAAAKIAKEKGISFHTDSVQSIGKTIFNVQENGCTTCTLSSHKFYGPKGIGALYIKRDTMIDKFIHGGKQERDRRGGTENIPAIAGMKKAVELLSKEMESDISKYRRLRKILLGCLKELDDNITINSLQTEESLPNIVNISFDTDKLKIDPETILIKLDLKGIAVSSGSACTSGAVQPSHVLKAIGYNDVTAKSSLRISFGRFNTEDDAYVFVDSLKEIFN